MKRPVLALLLAAACGNPDNLVLGGVASSSTTPLVLFDNINSSISAVVTLTDSSGNPTGQAATVVISDRPGLCSVLGAHPDYYRKPPEAYLALILFVPLINGCTGPPAQCERLGTFVVGRPGDEGTGGEIIATNAAQTSVTPFTALNGGFIALTNWSDNPGGSATGSFDMFFSHPTLGGPFEFSGRFKTQECPALSKTLLP